MKFTETEICKSKQYCIACRRDKKFQEQTKKQFGDWDCPLGIPFDAADSAMPEETIKFTKYLKDQSEKRKRKIQEAKIAFDELKLILSGDNLKRLEIIQETFFPEPKKAINCLNSGKNVGEVTQVCCGGTEKLVLAFECNKHVICTDKKCSKCLDFKKKEN